MAIHISASDKTDPGVLLLMQSVDQAGGSIPVSYDDIADLEAEQYFSYANDMGLIKMDYPDNWKVGGIIVITRKGRQYIQPWQGPTIWRKLWRTSYGDLVRRIILRKR